MKIINRIYLQFFYFFFVLLLMYPHVLHASVDKTGSVVSFNDRDSSTNISSTYGKLPLQFIENDGQVDAKVHFYERGSGHSTFFTEEGVYFSLAHRTADDNKLNTNNHFQGSKKIRRDEVKQEFAKLVFIGANPLPEIEAEDMLPGRVNYLVGSDPTKWRTEISTYSAVVYREVYPGIDIKFYGNQQQLEYDVIVSPGADPSQVHFAYEGIDGLSINKAGDMEISLKLGTLIQKSPVIYQMIEGRRVDVEGRFSINDSNNTDDIDRFTYSFEVAKYDPSHTLVIDPLLGYSTYLGGNSFDEAYAIAVDGSGNAYVAGNTSSTNFSPAGTPVQATNGGLIEAFVTKFNPSGSSLIYSTYIGGGGDDLANAIAVDGTGNVYVTGMTNSTNFPSAGTPAQAANGGLYDVFIAKLNPSGSSLIYSTYLGGRNGDEAHAIALDGSGNAYVAGWTYSFNFPLVGTSAQATNRGGVDAFVAKLNPSGSSLIYSTYLGGSWSDYANAIAVDGSGSAYVAGMTSSINFPPAGIPVQAANGGSYDVFVAKLDPSGSSWTYFTYLGGSGSDGANAIAVDGSGNAFVAGVTGSTNFPPAGTPVQATLKGYKDAFVAKLNPSGSSLIYSTFLGGSDGDEAYAIALDGSGNAYVAGNTSSTNFPTAGTPAQATNGGLIDAFVAKLNPSGSTLIDSTYLGGSGNDFAHAIALDGSGNAYVSGWTGSTNFPTAGTPAQATNAGNPHDAFVAKISALPPIPTPPEGAFDIAIKTEVERKPAVAYNTQADEFMAAYLVKQSNGNFELRARRFNSSGQSIGDEIAPFGIGTHIAVGRPDIAYSPNSNVYYVAVPERVNNQYDRVLSRPVSAFGVSLPVPLFLFDDGRSSVYDEHDLGVPHTADPMHVSGHSVVRVTHNSIRDEFLVSFQRSTPEYDPIAGLRDIHNVVARRVKGGHLEGSEVELYNSSTSGFASHSVGYAPVAGTTPSGGRYLFAVGYGSLRASMLDADGNVMPSADRIELHTGNPEGQESQPDIAFGKIKGKDRFIVVWSDGNNCKFPLQSCPNTTDQWTGVWGVYVDPAKTSFGPQREGRAFPISKIADHYKGRNVYMPRVAYNESFVTVWRELPMKSLLNDELGDESRSHIRSNYVDYYVPSDTSFKYPDPHDNVVFSEVSGSCPPATSPLQAGTCPSEQDPVFPDVAAVKNFQVVAVWEQHYPSNQTDHDINGVIQQPGIPPKNTSGSYPSKIKTTSATIDASLLGASADGTSSCGNTENEPDLWYYYVAPSAGKLHVNTCGSNDLFGEDTGLDTVISLHSTIDGTELSGSCNDDASSGNDKDACNNGEIGLPRDSALALNMLAGDGVLIRVTRFGGSTGLDYKLNVTYDSLPDGDSDGVPDDGDFSGSADDNPCTGGITRDCDDNCINTPNADQADLDGDLVGDACDGCVDKDGDGVGSPGGFNCPRTGEEDCDDNNNNVYPTNEETCDGIDNNCSGELDDDLGTITCGTGSCQVTVEACVSGQQQVCIPGNPDTEVCNDNQDNDCDGLTDGADSDCDVIPLNLHKGMNIISAPVNTTAIPDAYMCMETIDATGIKLKSISRYDQVAGVVQEAHYNVNGTKGGTNFTIIPGEGLIAYANDDISIEWSQSTCPVFNLTTGTNWVGTPCQPTHSTAFDMLSAIGGESVVTSIQRFNPESGDLETASYKNGQPAGVDFPIKAGDGYIIYMKQGKTAFKP